MLRPITPSPMKPIFISPFTTGWRPDAEWSHFRGRTWRDGSVCGRPLRGRRCVPKLERGMLVAAVAHDAVRKAQRRPFLNRNRAVAFRADARKPDEHVFGNPVLA